MNHTNLKNQARELRLSGLIQSLDLRLHEATTHRLPHAQFLELLFQDELNIRLSRTLQRRNQNATFRDQRTLDTFDFTFQPTLKRTQIYQLASGQFIRDHRDVLFIGPPGVGKSHLAQAIGQEVIKAGSIVLYRSVFDLARDLTPDPQNPAESERTLQRYLRADLLILDDMGMKNLQPAAREHLLEIIMRRYEVRSTLMTSNRPIDQWGTLLGDQPTATAILDRMLHRAEIITINGRSHRLHEAAAQATGGTAAAPTPSAPVISPITSQMTLMAPEPAAEPAAEPAEK